ncbi:Ku protein [Streptomyces sp. ISL-11]|uniref:Ku protein n=1 Tax=Streptomyces sp. ISL-11 TaxID=2819174 RepID=UPI002553C484|nr:Ku protein [Streptomyces sp. ISL-11]
MWSGAIGFGLVSVPVQMVPVIEEHDVKLREVHDRDGGRVRRDRVCDVCGEVVAYEHLARGGDRDGARAVLTEEDFDQLPVPSKKLIDVLAFVDAARISPLQLDRPYLLAAPRTSAALSAKSAHEPHPATDTRAPASRTRSSAGSRKNATTAPCPTTRSRCQTNPAPTPRSHWTSSPADSTISSPPMQTTKAVAPAAAPS